MTMHKKLLLLFIFPSLSILVNLPSCLALPAKHISSPVSFLQTESSDLSTFSFSFSNRLSITSTMFSTTTILETPFIPTTLKLKKPPLIPSCLFPSNLIYNSHNQNPIFSSSPNTAANKPVISTTPNHLLKPIILTPNEISFKSKKINGKKTQFPQVGSHQMLVLCGFGYWVQGFRCFPWLGLNFHMAHSLNFQPSTLQLVQNSANLPMVAKPLYGVLSDALYIGGAHRIPYISIGVLLQLLSWGTLAFVPVASRTLPALMTCMLFSNLGASITEVAKDALIAEYGKKWKMTGLQSYAFMGLAAGSILGNFFGGYFLLESQPKTMFLLFALLLSFQIAISLTTREDSLGLQRTSGHNLMTKSASENLRGQFHNLMTAISEERIFFPLYWIVASIAVVPILSGAIFCYQTQCLNLDSSIIGMSKVVGQLMLLSATVLYDRWWKRIPMRKLIGTVQLVYATTLLLDLILVKQINLKLGVSNEIYVLCLSGLAETAAQFRFLPFSVLFAKLCPPGCEGSLTSFLASALCLSSIVSGFLGVGLASLIGISSGNYSNLPLGIVIQFIAALVPLVFISFVPMIQLGEVKGMKGGRCRKNGRRLKR